MQSGKVLRFAAVCLAAANLGFTMLRAAEPSPAATAAGDGDVADVKVQVFKSASLKKLGHGAYPGSELANGNEGWVRLNFMVDPEGKPYEIAVEGSLGGEPFERNAIQALEKTTFQPATLNGEPVHSAFGIKYRFAMRDLQKGARRDFVRQYGLFTSEVEKGDRAAADALLPKLMATNLYEDAYRNVALYLYSLAWGTESEQIDHLKDAIAGESSDRYLAKKVHIDAIRALLTLNLQRGYLAEAIDYWEQLQKMAPADITKPYKGLMTEVQKIRDSSAPLKLRGEITRGTSWFHRLLRQTFSVDVLSGSVSDIKLRCEKSYVFFHFDPGVQYTVNRRDGQCEMELIGDPNTRFELIES